MTETTKQVAYVKFACEVLEGELAKPIAALGVKIRLSADPVVQRRYTVYRDSLLTLRDIVRQRRLDEVTWAEIVGLIDTGANSESVDINVNRSHTPPEAA